MVIIVHKSASGTSHCDCLYSAVEASGARSVWVRVWSPRRSAGALRAALARLAATRASATTLRLLPDTLYFEMHPALTLHVSCSNHLSS